jgi:hypothetical protein
MTPDAYRLWMQWQQMHYPRRGLPEDEAERARLVTLDGIAGTTLEACFCREARSRTLDAATFAELVRCRKELDPTAFSSDASRYFGRLQQLIKLLLDESESDRAVTRTARASRFSAKTSP